MLNLERKEIVHAKSYEKNETSFFGSFQYYRENVWYDFLYLKFSEIQMVCRNFGFNYGTVVQPNIIKKRYKSQEAFFFETINCLENTVNFSNCQVTELEKFVIKYPSYVLDRF